MLSGAFCQKTKNFCRIEANSCRSKGRKKHEKKFEKGVRYRDDNSNGSVHVCNAGSSR